MPISHVSATHLYGARGGALAPYGTRAPKELLHHLPAPVLRRPSESARPARTLPRVRGSRMRDRRPPHYRCPAVPGPTARPGDPDGAGSSVLPSGRSLTKPALHCDVPVLPILLVLQLPVLRTAVAMESATPRQPAPSPVLRLLWLGTPLPNLPVRAPAARRLYRGTTRNTLRVLRHCSWRPLITAGHPVRPSVPSPSCDNLASELHRHTVLRTTTSYCCPAVHFWRALLDLDYERNHNGLAAQCLLQPPQIFARLATR